MQIAFCSKNTFAVRYTLSVWQSTELREGKLATVMMFPAFSFIRPDPWMYCRERIQLFSILGRPPMLRTILSNCPGNCILTLTHYIEIPLGYYPWSPLRTQQSVLSFSFENGVAWSNTNWQQWSTPTNSAVWPVTCYINLPKFRPILIA